MLLANDFLFCNFSSNVLAHTHTHPFDGCATKMANKKKSIYSHIHETRLSSYAYSRIYNIRKCKRKKKYCLHSEEMKLKHLHQRQLSTMANGKVSLTWTVKWNDDAYLIKCIFSLLFFFFLVRRSEIAMRNGKKYTRGAAINILPYCFRSDLKLILLLGIN